MHERELSFISAVILSVWMLCVQRGIVCVSYEHHGKTYFKEHGLVQGVVAKCCPAIRSSTCASVCRTLPSGRIGLYNIEVLLETCKLGEAPFWKCMNESSHVLIGSSALQSCCAKMKRSACQFACYFSQSPPVMEKVCHRRSMNRLKRCLGRIQVSSLCCADTKDMGCYYNCLKMFSSEKGPDFRDIKNLTLHCQESPSIVQCVKNFGNSSQGGTDLGKCCHHSQGMQCKATCAKITSHQSDAKKWFAQLVKDCGFPLPQNRLWGCLLKSSAEQLSQKKEQVNKGVNLIIHHCCMQASTPQCQEWCHKIIQTPPNLRHMGMLSTDCTRKPSERKMVACVKDVVEPPKYGCQKKVNFCASFTSGPFQLYRRCNAHGDLIAQRLLTRWKSGDVVIGSFKFGIKSPNTCYPEMWRGVACWLALDPCKRNSHRMPICWNHCVELLVNCLKDTLKERKTSAEKICSVLISESKSNECYSLKRSAMGRKPQMFSLETPCHPSPCKETEICIVRRSCTGSQYNCTAHTCLPGCRLPKTSIIIPVNDYLKVNYLGQRQQCSKVCQCQRKSGVPQGSTLRCMDFGCVNRRSCLTKLGLFRHEEKFRMHCNFCTCSNGELICTKNHCGVGREKHLVKGLQCRCDPVYSLVCSTSGRTYSNLCLARCAGESDSRLTPGDCWSLPVCYNNSCSSHNSCSAMRRTCFEADITCPQHKCHYRKPRSKESKRELQTSMTVYTEGSIVCGMDGVTYEQRDMDLVMVPKDYDGPCLTLSQSNQNGPNEVRCKRVQCSEDKLKYCRPYQGKFSCCETCGAVVLALFSKKELKDHRLLVDKDAVTVQQIIRALRLLIEVAHCEARGYINTEESLTIIIQPNTKAREDLDLKSFKMQACHREAERIVGLYNIRSPIVTANYHLSFLKAVRLENSFQESTGERLKPGSLALSLVLALAYSRAVS